jgi:hypothetical protein
VGWTYGGDPGTGTAAQRRDAVRLLTGDTDTSWQLLSDEEIAYFLSLSSDKIQGASIKSVRAILAKLSRDVQTWIGHAREYGAERVTNYRQLLRDLESQDATLASIYVGGAYVADKTDLDNNAALVQPFFGRDRGYLGSDPCDLVCDDS